MSVQRGQLHYGNLAVQAATDTGFLGKYANNFMTLKAQEYGVVIDRDKIMRELMQADFEARKGNKWEPIDSTLIRKYHHKVFDENGLPVSAWTGTLLDDRAGPAVWCIKCNDIERSGQTWQDAVSNFVKNVAQDGKGTSTDTYNFFTDALRDGVLSETMADLNLDAFDSIEWAGVVKALYQIAAMSIQGYLDIASLINLLFNQFKNWTPPRTDPLALDLDNDGIETIGIGSTVVVFDHNADGIKTGTGWVKADDGFLVLDRNGNGVIDSGRELFGVDTLKSNGNLATNGFDALSDLDSNGDHLFSQADTQFGQAKVWRDLNQDGVSSSNELFTLPQLGIVSINLNATSQNVNLGNGNVKTASAAHLTVDGSGQTSNLDLANNPFYREFSDKITPTAQALTLPDSKGSGFVRDLREAVSLSPTVASALTSYANQTNYADQKALLDDLLFAWANTSTLQSSIEQADQKGYFLIYLPPDQTQASYDQHMGYWNNADVNILNALTPEKRASYELLRL